MHQCTCSFTAPQSLQLLLPTASVSWHPRAPPRGGTAEPTSAALRESQKKTTSNRLDMEYTTCMFKRKCWIACSLTEECAWILSGYLPADISWLFVLSILCISSGSLSGDYITIWRRTEINKPHFHCFIWGIIRGKALLILQKRTKMECRFLCCSISWWSCFSNFILPWKKRGINIPYSKLFNGSFSK